MQNKGFISTIAILLVLICGFTSLSASSLPIMRRKRKSSRHDPPRPATRPMMSTNKV